MTSGSSPDAKKRHLFKLAIEKQVQVAKRTNAGLGIDNHLLALMNLAKEEGTDAILKVGIIGDDDDDDDDDADDDDDDDDDNDDDDDDDDDDDFPSILISPVDPVMMT